MRHLRIIYVNKKYYFYSYNLIVKIIYRSKKITIFFGFSNTAFIYFFIFPSQYTQLPIRRFPHFLPFFFIFLVALKEIFYEELGCKLSFPYIFIHFHYSYIV